MTDRILHRPADLRPFTGALPAVEGVLTPRVNAEPGNVERGLAQLVLTIIELLRQLMERQALRRVDDGTLTDDQIERLGRTLLELNDRMQELLEEFEIDPDDLNLRLGPLGNLL